MKLPSRQEVQDCPMAEGGCFTADPLYVHAKQSLTEHDIKNVSDSQQQQSI